MDNYNSFWTQFPLLCFELGDFTKLLEQCKFNGLNNNVGSNIRIIAVAFHSKGQFS